MCEGRAGTRCAKAVPEPVVRRSPLGAHYAEVGPESAARNPPFEKRVGSVRPPVLTQHDLKREIDFVL